MPTVFRDVIAGVYISRNREPRGHRIHGTQMRDTRKTGTIRVINLSAACSVA
jgi:ribosomal protein L14